MRRVCVFCGSMHGARPEYDAAAAEMGRAIVRRGLSLVYGGGCVGLMGTLADAVLNAGGEVIGVIPEALVAKELAHHGVSELRVVGSMHERKALMAELADAFIAMPGGFGTLEEFCEVLTWAQLGMHAKPCGLLNVAGYYDPLVALFAHAATEDFITADHRALVLTEGHPDRLLDALADYCPPALDRWIRRRDQT